MIKHWILIARCMITNHDYVSGGSCPFTGKTYKACTKCTKLVPL
jgi:hypothetical protein